MYFLGVIHKTYAGSIACCTGAAAVIPGSVVYRTRRSHADGVIAIGHPGGVMEVEAICDSSGPEPRITRICYGRTARRIMDGYCYVPNSFFEPQP